MSATTDPSRLLRTGLLDGVRVLVAGRVGEPSSASLAAGHGESASMGAAVASTCAELGADVSRAAPGENGPVDVDLLVVDGAGLFAAVGRDRTDARDARAALSACLDGAWQATRAVANAAFIDGGRAGRVVYVAPPSGRGEARDARHADAARAGLENLARTLSIEWARYGITLVAIAPGAQTSAADVALVTAFLASPAGAYYSGCQLDLRGIGGEPADLTVRPDPPVDR